MDFDYFGSGGGGGGGGPSRDLLELDELQSSLMSFSQVNEEEDMGFDLFDDGGSSTILPVSTADSTRAPVAAMDLLESHSALKKIKSESEKVEEEEDESIDFCLFDDGGRGGGGGGPSRDLLESEKPEFSLLSATNEEEEGQTFGMFDDYDDNFTKSTSKTKDKKVIDKTSRKAEKETNLNNNNNNKNYKNLAKSSKLLLNSSTNSLKENIPQSRSKMYTPFTASTPAYSPASPAYSPIVDNYMISTTNFDTTKRSMQLAPPPPPPPMPAQFRYAALVTSTATAATARGSIKACSMPLAPPPPPHVSGMYGPPPPPPPLPAMGGMMKDGNMNRYSNLSSMPAQIQSAKKNSSLSTSAVQPQSGLAERFTVLESLISRGQSLESLESASLMSNSIASSFTSSVHTPTISWRKESFSNRNKSVPKKSAELTSLSDKKSASNVSLILLILFESLKIPILSD